MASMGGYVQKIQKSKEPSHFCNQDPCIQNSRCSNAFYSHEESKQSCRCSAGAQIFDARRPIRGEALSLSWAEAVECLRTLGSEGLVL